MLYIYVIHIVYMLDIGMLSACNSAHCVPSAHCPVTQTLLNCKTCSKCVDVSYAVSCVFYMPDLDRLCIGVFDWFTIVSIVIIVL